MEITRESLLARYREFSDEALAEAVAAGPEGYAPVAWEVIRELVAARGIVPGQVAPEPSAVVPEAAASAVSRYLLWSRLVQGARWPEGQPLPLSGRDFLAVIALLSGVVGAAALVIILVFTEGPLSGGMTLPVLGLSTALAIGFGVSANRDPSPGGWTIAMVYSAIAPLASLVVAGDGRLWSLVTDTLALLSGLLWLLYFARRRATYGLPEWRGVM